MVCISICTRRPAQFWPDRVLCLPGLVDLIKQSGVDHTFYIYKKKKRYSNNEAHPSVLFLTCQVSRNSKFCRWHPSIKKKKKKVWFYVTNSMDFRTKFECFSSIPGAQDVSDIRSVVGVIILCREKWYSCFGWSWNQQIRWKRRYSIRYNIAPLFLSLVPLQDTAVAIMWTLFNWMKTYSTLWSRYLLLLMPLVTSLL